MLCAYLDFLEKACEVDVAEERASTRRKNRAIGRYQNLSERAFRKRYRLSRELFFKLVDELRPHIPVTLRSDGLDVETKILLALSFFATGSYQTPLGDNGLHPVSQASVSKALGQVIAALNNPSVLNKYVAFPFRRTERENIKRRFYSATGMPGVLGCIDGTHIAIVAPKNYEERYINRKGYHSLNVMIICDSDLNVMAVESSYPGSIHDSRVWEGHPLKDYIERLYSDEEDLYILGDSGYPLRATLMTPILNTEPGSPESYYTQHHKAARSPVERCIRVLKARFRCLLVDRRLHYAPATAAKIVNACCVLHNIAHRAGIDYQPLMAQELRRERELTQRASVHPPAPREGAFRASQLRAGRERRDMLVRLLWRQRNIKH